MSKPVDAEKLSPRAILHGVAAVIKETKAQIEGQTDSKINELSQSVDERLSGLDGSAVLRGVAMALYEGQRNAIRSHLDDVVLRRSALVEGQPPVFVKSLLDAGKGKAK